MTNGHDPFEKMLDDSATFKSDLLSGLDKSEWPGRIDYVASRITEGDYAVGLGTGNETFLSSGYDLEKTARDYYLRGIAALTDDIGRQNALPSDFGLGNLLVEFAGLQKGLEDVDRRDVPPGEILSRTIMRTVQRQADERQAQLARQLRADAETPRELVTELTTAPELAPLVESALPNPDDPATLTTELASLDVTTELWDHQLESLALWLRHDMNAYVDMATATGKTVLGLAAIAHAVDSGSLHPADQDRLADIFDGSLPDPHRNRPNDVLIVTTDDLLGVQWARLFQDHCHTPPAFTQIDESGIQLPWGRIDIRSARGLDDVDPSDYRLAIFDEVHNYSARSGWGSHLQEFVESPCPVLALTGSVTEELESLAADSDRPFPLVYRYTHDLALADGVIPDFEWTLAFTGVADSNALSQFRETAARYEGLVEYDCGTYHLDADSLAQAAPSLATDERAAMAGDYVSGSALASGLRSVGDDETAPTDELEALASGTSNRTIHRLNLKAELGPVIAAAERALEEERPVLVLTRSYSEAKDVWEALYDRHGDRVVERLDADQDATEQDDVIQSFDEADTDEKALVGPGKRIGQGNDIQSVEVGINVSRPGSGVNATLVQRLGRLLRDAGGKDTVDFYHVVGVPPADAAIDADGESFVRTVAEFFGQVVEPDTDGILKPPSVSIESDVGGDIDELERLGAPHVRGDEQSTPVETAYASAIEERPADAGPTVATDWFDATFGDGTRPPGAESAGAGRVETTTPDDDRTDGDRTGETTEETTRESEAADDGTTDETAADEAEVSTGAVETATDDDADSGADDVDAAAVVSPLAEHYDAFRSLGIIHRALRESAGETLPETDPCRRWMDDARSILLDEGYGDQEVGYGKQQSTRSPLSIKSYREAHGTGNRITDFEALTVARPSEIVTTLLDESLSDLSSWVVPVAPDSAVPLPVVVESEQELDRARSLLDEFEAEPAVFAEDERSDTSE